MIAQGIRTKPSLGAQIDWTHPLSRNLAACWLFNDAGGARVTDLCGRYHGTIPNSTNQYNWRGSRSGIGLNIPNPSARLTIPTLTTTTTFSVEIWLNVAGFTNNYGVVLTNTGDSGGIWTRSSALTFEGTGTDHLSTTFAINTWMHMVVTVNAGAGAWYNNTVKNTTWTGTVTADYSGMGWFVNEGFNGTLDTMRVWVGRALTQAEINQLYVDPFCMLNQSQRKYFYLSSAAAAQYRRTLSELGTRSGARQVVT